MSAKTSQPASGALFALAGLSLLPLACGGVASDVYPVKGQVFVRGQPAAGAAVTYHPLNADESGRIPTATVGPDGSFRLTTVSAYDGAPPGDYAVTITWCDSYRDEGETRSGPDKLQGRYANTAGSGLKATVQSGNNPPVRFDLN